MQIEQQREGDRLTLIPDGRVDTITAPELETAAELNGVGELIVDLARVDYMSSAGLRVMLGFNKKMAGRSMKLIHLQPAVKEVFDITGFSDMLDIQ